MAYEQGLGVAKAPTAENDAGTISWRHPDLDVEVYVQPSPAALIPERALEAYLSKPPAETAGLLLGSIFHNGSTRTFLVLDVEFLQSANKSANYFQPLLTKIRKYRSAGLLTPIGYFRSTFQEDFNLRPEDLSLMRQAFPGSECVALLVRPQDTGDCMARFFLAENGNVHEERSSPEPETVGREAKSARGADTPVSRGERSLPQNPPPAALDETTPSPFLVHKRPTAAPIPAPESPAWRIQLSAQHLTWIGLALCIILLAVGPYSFWRSQPNRNVASIPQEAPPPVDRTGVDRSVKAQPGLGLEVTRPMPGELDITWNRGLLADATGGFAQIKDGSINRSLFLDATQLQQGKLAYFPIHTDVSVRLDVNFPEGRAISESVRVIGSEVLTGGSKTPVPIASKPVRQAAVSAPIPAPVSVPQVAKADPRPKVAPPTLPGVEQLAPTAQAPAELLEGNLQLPAMPRPPQLVPSDNAPKSVDARPPASAPIARKPIPQVAKYEQPKPIRQVVPNMRIIMPGGVSQLTRVEIGVQVDKAGRVTDVQPRSEKGILTNACIDAARQWIFAPARLNGEKVNGGYIIVFVFRPQTYSR